MKKLLILLSLFVLSLGVRAAAPTQAVEDTPIYGQKLFTLRTDGFTGKAPLIGNDAFDLACKEKLIGLSQQYPEAATDFDLYKWNDRIVSAVFKLDTPFGKRYHSVVCDTLTKKILTLSDVLSKDAFKDGNFTKLIPYFENYSAFADEDGKSCENADFALTEHSLSICVNKERSDGYICVIPLTDSHVCPAVRNKAAVMPWEKAVAFTFDDGPSEHTEKILEFLRERGAKATFFVLGCHVEGNEKLLSEMERIGCEVALHGYSHTDMRAMSPSKLRSEVENTKALIMTGCEKEPSLLRAPYGEFTKDTAKLGYHQIKWSVDTRDWISQNKDDVYRSIITTAESGDIILLHDIFKSSAQGFCKAADEMIEKGYRLVTVSELLGLSSKKPDGTVYHKAE